MSDYSVLMAGGASLDAPETLPETGYASTPAGDSTRTRATTKAEALAAFPERDIGSEPTVPAPRDATSVAYGDSFADAIARTRAVKAALASGTGTGASLPAPATATPAGLWSLARRPSPLFGLPWGVVVGAAVVGAIVYLRRGRDDE